MMRSVVVVAAGALTFACAPARNDALSAESTAAPPVVAQAPVAREVYIDSVRIGETILVYGRARTFENTVQVRVRNDSGRVVADTFTTSVGEMGNHNPYVATIRLSGFTGPRLRVEAFEYSANDGSVRSLVDTLIPYARPR
jgi:hypothetical protein